MQRTKDEFPDFNPNQLLDGLHRKLQLKNDAALARVLEVNPPIISKIRHKRLPVGGALLIRIHEVSGLAIADLLSMMGDRRRKFRVSDVHGKPRTSELSNASWPVPAR